LTDGYLVDEMVIKFPYIAKIVESKVYNKPDKKLRWRKRNTYDYSALLEEFLQKAVTLKETLVQI